MVKFFKGFLLKPHEIVYMHVIEKHLLSVRAGIFFTNLYSKTRGAHLHIQNLKSCALIKHLAHHSIDCRGNLVLKYHMSSMNLSAILVKQWLKGFSFQFLMPLTLT